AETEQGAPSIAQGLLSSQLREQPRHLRISSSLEAGWSTIRVAIVHRARTKLYRCCPDRPRYFAACYGVEKRKRPRMACNLSIIDALDGLPARAPCRSSRRPSRDTPTGRAYSRMAGAA